MAGRTGRPCDYVKRLATTFRCQPSSVAGWTKKCPSRASKPSPRPTDGILGTHTFEWPLAQDRRAHVHRRIETAELPVTHETRRRGRPYTLVLAKTDELFERERQRRRRDEADLAWLDRKRAAVAGRRAGLKSCLR